MNYPLEAGVVGEEGKNLRLFGKAGDDAVAAGDADGAHEIAAVVGVADEAAAAAAVAAAVAVAAGIAGIADIAGEVHFGIDYFDTAVAVVAGVVADQSFASGEEAA